MAFPWGYEAFVWASAAAYVFASCLLWVILWALLLRDWKSAAAVSLAPLVGALLWGVINELTKPAEAVLLAERVPILNVTHFRLRSTLSPLFYQYRSL